MAVPVAMRGAVPVFVDGDAEETRSGGGSGTHGRIGLTDPAGEHQHVRPVHDGDVQRQTESIQPLLPEDIAKVRARRSRVVIDLHSPQISDGDIEVDLDLDHATITLLVAEETVIDQRELAWTGRGKVKQTYHHNPGGTGRRIRLTGQARHGEVRVHSGGIARLSAMRTREYLADARRAHAHGAHAHGGTMPTLDDPARSA